MTMPHDQNLSNQLHALIDLMAALEQVDDQAVVEQMLTDAFESLPDGLESVANDYYSVLNAHLYHHVLNCYKHQEDNVCLWRYIKTLSGDQLNYQHGMTPSLHMLDHLMRVYFYSDPLDDLTCLFIPVNDNQLIKQYLNWIKSYFYEANYPTSLLWLYALDSSLATLFPDEIVYVGKRLEGCEGDDIMTPDFEAEDTVLLKRFSSRSDHYLELRGVKANDEFRQIFGFLQQEYKDRCLSRSGQQADDVDPEAYHEEWEDFEDVLRYGVSDKTETGCISFSDMRSSTEFLNRYGKSVYLNKIQQPFFERTKFISRHYSGRIDKFMGDNVMCVFLDRNMTGQTEADKATDAVLNNFFALFGLCKVLSEIIESGYQQSKLGLRSGVTYGNQILRSNLGNEIVRDFTVTGKVVNLAARLEHISIQELKLHNDSYFEKVIHRFPEVNRLLTIHEDYTALNPETKKVIEDFTVYQNITSNLEKLDGVKFDIRLNQDFYDRLRAHLLRKGYRCLNPDKVELHGYEQFHVEGVELTFYFSYYNPKGFSRYEKIWLLPLEVDVLNHLDIERIR